MLIPTVASRLNWLYAMGNTPATSLTRSVPIGVDTDVLSLGCGDVRNILFTAYMEQKLASRKIDITCCDYDEKLIGRNIVLLTLILNNDEHVTSACLWDLYYHVYMQDEILDILLKHLQKLVPLLKSLSTWNAGKYGMVIKFCDQDSLDDVRGICAKLLHDVEDKSSTERAKASRDSVEGITEAWKEFLGTGMNLTGMRSAAPLSLKSHNDVVESCQTYSKHGMVSPSCGGTKVPNPMFSSLVSETNVLHYGSDPVLGFHLATAFAPLSASSPLRHDGSGSDPKIVAAAKLQFFKWVSAFQDIAPRRIVLRFIVADALSCCHTLQYVAATGKTSANWYRRQWDLKNLTLDGGQYSASGKSPTSFDVIDTSNLSDHIGALNIIIATSSLLKAEPWATLYTEILIKRGDSQQAAFEALLCGQPATISLLLGVSPAQYWTNAKCESHVDEVFLGMMGNNIGGGDSQLHNRLAWKRDDQMSGQLRGRGKLHMEVSALVRLLFDTYLRMFSSENYKLDPTTFQRSSTYAHFHRGSFASFLKVVKHRVKTDWPSVCAQLIDRISQDRTLALSTNQMQELGVQMHLQDVNTESWLLGDSGTLSTAGRFRYWKNIPLAVAVTIVVPRAALDRLFDRSKKHKMSAPTLVGSLRGTPESQHEWHNVYGDVHIVFGTMKNAPDNEDTPLVIEKDERGWSGKSPLIASFVVPAAALQVDPGNTVVGLCIPPSAQAAVLYTPILGPEMTMFETRFSAASSVFVTKFMPGQHGHRITCAAMKDFPDVVEDENKTKRNYIMADLPASESRITTLTGHVDILSNKGKGLLRDKTAIELRQRSPFIIDVVFGQNKLTCPLTFPAPVTKVGSRSRVARTSAYVEVIAPIASPKDGGILADYIYPCILNRNRLPVALNASHLNLDALPILDLGKRDQMEWLVTLTSLEFSPREKKLREEANTQDGISEHTRVNFKESLFTMFMMASGLQGGQTGMFAINHPQKGGIHMLVFVSALRLDADNSSVVLDAAVLPLTNELVTSGRMEPFLLLIRTLECCTVNVDDEELVLWKKALPALAERCRTWTHKPECEYKRPGATVPLSVKPGEQVLCSCGNGKLPDAFISLPEWDKAAPNAVRIAISPTFSVPLVEDVVDPADVAKGKGLLETTARCRKCGAEKAKDGGDLKRCMRCKAVKYCSADCQKRDWKKHRMECKE